MPAWFLNAGLIFEHAKNSYQRSSTAATPTTGGQTDALTAVVFSAVALEAFINELVDVLRGYETESEASLEPRLLTLATILEDFDEQRASLESKFLVAKWIIDGNTYDKGRQPYQDFKLQLDLRNSLVHYRSDRMTYDPVSGIPRSEKSPAFLSGLESKGLLATFSYKAKDSSEASGEEVEVYASRLAKISTPALARWACNSTAAMVRSILDALPNDQNGEFLRHIYREAFTPIP